MGALRSFLTDERAEYQTRPNDVVDFTEQDERYAKTPHAVAQDDTLSGYAKSVYMVIHSFDWGGGCKQSQAEIARLAGWAVSTTKAAIGELETHGLLRVDRTKGARGTYHILIPPSRHTAKSTASSASQPSRHTAEGSRHTASNLAATRLPPHTPNKEEKKTREEDKEKRVAPDGASADAPPPAQNHRPSEQAPRAPSAAWVDPLIDAIGAAIGWKHVGDKTRAAWRPLLAPLASCSPEERCRFPVWLTSGNGHWKGRGFQLTHSLALECEAFVSAGCPVGKPVPRGHGRDAPPRTDDAAYMEQRKAHHLAKYGNLIGWDSFDVPPGTR